MGRKIFFIVCCVIFFLVQKTQANFITANSSNYTTFLGSLLPGDTLYLTPGNYTNNLNVNSINGTALLPIVIMGSANLYTTVFQAQSCCNTVSITKSSYITIKNLQLDGLNIAVDAVKGEGSSGNWAHHISIEYLNIINYGNNQQIVGISTKCHAWNWIIRKNRIIGAGTGMYLGNSNGDKPFVNGVIENNLIMNTIGYNIEIKHQTDTVRDNYPGTNLSGKTILRHNVFCKESNASTGGNARPNLLVGGFPLNGAGVNDYYEIYGNFFYQNPTEALFQGTGNIMLYENVFVNHVDPLGYRTVYITPQNGVAPQNIKVFHNTMWSANSSGGIRLLNPNTSYQQYCYANAVFATSPITNFTTSVDNITDTYSNAINHVISATTSLSTLNMIPQSGQLTGVLTPSTLFQTFNSWDKDFNNDLYNWTHRGAYSGCCTNNGWQLQLDTMPDFPTLPTSVFNLIESKSKLKAYPNPFSNNIIVESSEAGELKIYSVLGNVIMTKLIEKGSSQIVMDAIPSGMYFLQLQSSFHLLKVVKE